MPPAFFERIFFCAGFIGQHFAKVTFHLPMCRADSQSGDGQADNRATRQRHVPDAPWPQLRGVTGGAQRSKTQSGATRNRQLQPASDAIEFTPLVYFSLTASAFVATKFPEISIMEIFHARPKIARHR